MKPQILLKVLLVLSMINAVMNFFDSFNIVFLPALYERVPDAMEQYGFDEHTVGAMRLMVEKNLSLPQAFYLILMGLWAASLTGCLLMWRLRRVGFHCYTIAQLLMIPMPVFFLDKGAMNLGNIMFTALFVFYYWRLLKTLGPETPESLDSPESPETPETPESPEPSESSD